MDYETFAKQQKEQPNPLLKQVSIFDQPVYTPTSSDAGSLWVIILYLLAAAGLIGGGMVFVTAETSIHEILATLIGLMGAIFFAAGAVVTELQRIKKQLQWAVS